jgi:hypothetical protein
LGGDWVITAVRPKKMNEGWNGDDYLIRFDEAESEPLTEGYGIRQFLPGLTVVGILGWDDFILRNQGGQLFRVPTVPLVQRYVESLDEARVTMHAQRSSSRTAMLVTSHLALPG